MKICFAGVFRGPRAGARSAAPESYTIEKFMAAPSLEVTRILVDLSNGNREAVDQVTPLIYGELRRLAASYMRRERPGHTVQATELVHEAYLRLVDQRAVTWQNRAHFLGVAAQVMRYILLDYAKGHRAAKRGGGAEKVQLDEALAGAENGVLDILCLDDALTRLAAIDANQAKIVELRFYAGLSVEETAEAMSISTATVKREWRMARAWLQRELGPEAPGTHDSGPA